MSKPPTYEELKAQRAAEWDAAQKTAATLLAQLHEQILKMPDVAGAPAQGSTWSNADIFCDNCASKYFTVVRWVTVNGVRYRTELDCQNCGRKDTWDWATQQWMGG